MSPVDDRPATVGARHHLAPARRAASLSEATADLVAMHATDPSTVWLGFAARVHDATVATIEDALYDQRSLVRVMAMRRTIFVVRPGDAAVVMAACGLRIARRERAALVMGLTRGSDVTDPEPWVEDVMAQTAAAIAAAGEITARELSARVPVLATRWNPAPGSKFGGETPVTSRIVSQLATEGIVERGRPMGATFTSTQYRWRMADPAVRAAALALDEDDARAVLIGRWLERFGPATEADIVWWTGLTKTQVRAAVATVAPETVDLDGTVGYRVGPVDDGVDDGIDDTPWVALLPGLDPTSMGWRDRDWYLGPHRDALFDRAGNVGPTIWADGRIVGAWAQRRDDAIATGFLEPVSDDHRDLAAIEAQRVADFLGDVRVVPRFRTPLERRLADGADR